jgi:hypothetical protein
MPRAHHLSIRLGSSYDRVRAMAAARTTSDEDVPASRVVRELLSEALTARGRICAREHRGPVAGGVCGNCGAGAP